MINVIITFLLAIINSMLIDNVILSRFYGICPFLGVSKKPTSALGMGVAVTVVIVIASLIIISINCTNDAITNIYTIVSIKVISAIFNN